MPSLSGKLRACQNVFLFTCPRLEFAIYLNNNGHTIKVIIDHDDLDFIQQESIVPPTSGPLHARIVQSKLL